MDILSGILMIIIMFVIYFLLPLVLSLAKQRSLSAKQVKTANIINFIYLNLLNFVVLNTIQGDLLSIYNFLISLPWTLLLWFAGRAILKRNVLKLEEIAEN